MLREKLYSMADNENQAVYEPLELKWILPIDSTKGTNSIIKNMALLLKYAQENKCNKAYIDKVIENDVCPMVSDLKDEMDFILTCIFIVMSSNVEDYSNTDELMSLAQKILGKFIEALELIYDDYIRSENKQADADEYTIDISRLEIGMVIKNYRELCKILGEEVMEGNSKKAQLKEWERYFLWEKKGQKFIILDIYDEPLPKDDGRQNKNIYVQYIEVILMKILSKQRNAKDPFYITTNQMWKLLGMINNNYKNISLDDLNDKITDYEITSFDMKKFYQRCNQRLREILFSSLNKLEDRALIKYEIETVIVFIDEDKKTVYQPANDLQKKRILKAERKTLLDMELETKRHVYAKFKDVEFFERMNAYLREWYGWEYTFNRIKINYNKPDILETVYVDEAKLKNDFNEIKLQRLGLNDKVVEALYNNAQTLAENRHKKSDEEYQIAVDKYMDEHVVIGSIPESFLPTKKDFGIFDYSPYFVEIQNRLTDELISIRKPRQERTIIDFNDSDSKELDEMFKN